MALRVAVIDAALEVAPAWVLPQLHRRRQKTRHTV
jgi:hypothetical protein